LRKVEGETEGIMSQFIDCCTGEVAMILLLSEPTFDVEPNALVIATISGKHEQAQVVLERTLQDLAADGYEQRRHDFAGVTIIEATKAAAVDPPADAESEYYCLTDRHLLMGDSLETMKEVLVGLLREPSGALAAQPDYQACRRALGRDADLFAYTNSAALMAVLAAQPESDREHAEARRAFRALGLDQVRALGVAAGVWEQDLWLSAYVYPANREGLFGMFPGVQGRYEPPGWVPEDALSYLWLDLDFDRGWQWLNALVRTMSPPDYMTFRNSLVIPEPTGEPILDVERDLIGPLGEGVWVYLRLRGDVPQVFGSDGAEGQGPASLFERWELVEALDLKDGPSLAATVERLREQGLPPFSLLHLSDFQGQRLYTLSSAAVALFSLPLPPGEGEPPSAGEGVLSFAVVTGLAGGDKLVVSPRLQALEDLLLRAGGTGGGGDSAARRARALARVPGGSPVFLVVYNDLRGHLSAVGEYVRRRGRLPTWVSFDPLALLNLLDLQSDLWPPDEDLLPYLDSSVLFGTRDEEGLLLQFLILTPSGQGTPTGR